MTDSVMSDPSPENIEGQKVVSHTFSHEMRHEVNWSHVALAVAAIFVVYVLFLRNSTDDEESANTAALG